MRVGDYAKARVEYERFVELMEGPPGDVDVEQSIRADAQLSLARIYALLSVGRTSPTDSGGPVDPVRAKECRDRAFVHLEKWFDIGLVDSAAGRDDLAPLHDDPRWEKVWGSMSPSK